MMHLLELYRHTVNLRVMGKPTIFCFFTEAKEWSGQANVPELIEKTYGSYGTREVPGRWGWFWGRREREPVVRYTGMVRTELPYLAVPHGDRYLMLNAGKDALHGASYDEVKKDQDTEDRVYHMARERGLVPARWVYLGSAGPSDEDIARQLQEGRSYIERELERA